MGDARDIIENNIKVWKSPLKLVCDDISLEHSMLFRMRCQAAGARYGDVNQAAKNAQVRGLRLDLSCNSEGLCSIIESLQNNTLLPIFRAAEV